MRCARPAVSGQAGTPPRQAARASERGTDRQPRRSERAPAAGPHAIDRERDPRPFRPCICPSAPRSPHGPIDRRPYRFDARLSAASRHARPRSGDTRIDMNSRGVTARIVHAVTRRPHLSLGVAVGVTITHLYRPCHSHPHGLPLWPMLLRTRRNRRCLPHQCPSPETCTPAPPPRIPGLCH